MITALVMTDGRYDVIEKTIDSFYSNVSGTDINIIHDDSGDSAYLKWLRSTYGDFVICSTGRRSGFDGAMRSAWSFLLNVNNFDRDFVFHLEDDFTFNKAVDLNDVVNVLNGDDDLQQMAFVRQAWNEQEVRAGGLINVARNDYHLKTSGDFTWLEHRKFFTTNPCVYRASLMKRGWPSTENSEGVFSIDLLSKPSNKCGYWGRGDEWVTHIGVQRKGIRY